MIVKELFTNQETLFMNQINKILVKPIFTICILIVFISCEKDLYEESMAEQKQGIISRRISFDELKTNPNVIKELDGVKAKLKSNTIWSERIISFGDFFIETDDVLLLEYGGLQSYTFPIYFTEEDAQLKNLVIAEKLDGTYTSKVLEYELTDQEKIDLANDELKSISNPIVTTILDSSVNCTQISYSVIVACSTGQHNATNIGEWNLCIASERPKIKVITELTCNGGGSGGDGPGSGVPYDYPNSQTNPEEYENGISQPVNPNLNNVNTPSGDPCIKIKAKTSSTDYMLKFNNINLPANYAMVVETGFAEVKRNGNLQYIDGIPRSDFKLEIPDDSIGFTHVHNNKIQNVQGDMKDLAVKILSPEDLLILLKGCSAAATNAGGTPLDAYGIMISNEGIFALTLNDPNINIAELEASPVWVKFRKNYYEKSSKIVNETAFSIPERKERLQIMLLRELKKLNLQDKINLFEGTVNPVLNKINWTKKTLNNNSIVPTPC